MTTSARRVAVFFGALGCVSLALILAAEAAAAPASVQSGRKRRSDLASVGQQFQVQPASWLSLRPVWAPPGAAVRPPAAPRVAAESLVIESRATRVIFSRTGAPPSRGGHGSTNIPKWLPPFTGPASPTR